MENFELAFQKIMSGEINILQATIAVLITAFLVGLGVTLKEGIVEEFLPNFLKCFLIVFAYFVVMVLTVNLSLLGLSLFM